MPKKPAPPLPEDLWTQPEDLWTATHQGPEDYHAQKMASRLPEDLWTPPEDLWTTKHYRPEGYHAQKNGSTSARRPLDRTRRPLDCNTSKARRLACSKNRLHVCQKTFGLQHIKGRKATRPEKQAPHLPDDLWTTPEDLRIETHQSPKGP